MINQFSYKKRIVYQQGDGIFYKYISIFVYLNVSFISNFKPGTTGWTDYGKSHISLMLFILFLIAT